MGEHEKWRYDSQHKYFGIAVKIDPPSSMGEQNIEQDTMQKYIAVKGDPPCMVEPKKGRCCNWVKIGAKIFLDP